MMLGPCPPGKHSRIGVPLTPKDKEESMTTDTQNLEALEQLADGHRQILAEIRKVIVGQDDVIDELLMALFANGHCLLVGVPGLAKTLMVSSLAEMLDLEFNRIQFTPDLMPSDITGTEILEEDRTTGKRISSSSRVRSSPM
jgi:MoxR-like ATPase